MQTSMSWLRDATVMTALRVSALAILAAAGCAGAGSGDAPSVEPAATLKSQTHDAVFALLGQERLGKPRRLWWAASLQKSFGIDPLVDRDGQRMRWTRRVPPTLTGRRVPVKQALAAS